MCKLNKKLALIILATASNTQFMKAEQLSNAERIQLAADLQHCQDKNRTGHDLRHKLTLGFSRTQAQCFEDFNQKYSTQVQAAVAALVATFKADRDAIIAEAQQAYEQADSSLAAILQDISKLPVAERAQHIANIVLQSETSRTAEFAKRAQNIQAFQADRAAQAATEQAAANAPTQVAPAASETAPAPAAPIVIEATPVPAPTPAEPTPTTPSVEVAPIGEPTTQN